MLHHSLTALLTPSLPPSQFIVLDKIEREFRALLQRKWSPPGEAASLPRLYDLVAPSNDKFRTAFYLALRNTLVASDLEEAVRVAYPSGSKSCLYRVVTLGGDVIDTSGTMSGGGRAVRRGGMRCGKGASASSKAASASAADVFGAAAMSPKEAAACEAALNEAKEALMQARNARSILSREVQQLTKRLRVLEVDATKAANAIEAAQASLKELAAQRAAVLPSVKPSAAEEARIAKLQQDAEAAQVELAKVTKVTAPLEADIRELQERIRQIGGARLAKQQKKAKAAAEAVEECSRAVTKARSDVKTGAKAKAKAEKAVRVVERGVVGVVFGD